MKTKTKLCLSLMFAIVLMSMPLTGCGGEPVESSGSLNAASDETKQDAQEEQQDADAAQAQPDDPEAFLADIPEWTGYAFCYVNGNKPDFAPEEIWTSTQESLEPLDELGRCGTANSCIGTDGMPTEGRGDISEIHPTGWHTERYDFVEGEALYNRCHLIAHMLSGDDAIPRNLVTGTSYMNRDGMLPFEEAIAAYVKGTGNHVMYRVTPVFAGDELVCRGVHMEAVSVEDDGAGLSFNVFCYNVQPGIDIDYKTGDNKLSEDTEMLEDYQAGRFALIANTHSETSDNSFIADEPQSGEGAEDEGQNEQKSQTRTYILNTNTGKFHYPDCRSVKDMKDKNKQEVEATREEIIERGFEPCGNCKP